ncbi:hypothetical protein LZ30DRAFT_417922 [Colletotrichum cereale]|nr:hypothetical protein LZ30DRAFT_417922 [Colletotrichum cereale]
MFDAMEKAVDRWERGYNTHYDSDGSDADSDKSREYRRFSGSSPSASSSTDASSAYPSASSGGYSRTIGNGNGYSSQHAYQQSVYQEQNWGMDNMSLATGSTQHASTVTAGLTSHGSRKTRASSRPVDSDYTDMQLQPDYQNYVHSGAVDDFDELASSSYIDSFEPVFDVVSTVPSDYHSYTLDADQGFPIDYPAQGHYSKDTINPKDIHNTLIGMGSATMPRYLLENEEDAGIVLHDTQEYLGFAGQARRSRR